MKLRERLQAAKRRLAKVILRLPVDICDEVLELAEEVQKAKQDGFTDQEIDELCEELASLLKKIQQFKREMVR